MNRTELELFLNKTFRPEIFDDYGPNGLQIEGNAEITKIAFSVSATKDSIEKAVELKADTLIVHHGLFWKFHGTRTITGPFYKRIAPLIKNNINLYSYHLPLDAHIEIGNAASLAKILGVKNISPFAQGKNKDAFMGVKGQINLTVDELKKLLEEKLKKSILLSTPSAQKQLNSVGIITGGANSEWKLALKDNLDAYITGEMSEHDWHEAKESEIVMFAGGHHATEQFGIQTLKKKIETEFKLECVYIDSNNPA